MITPHTTTLDLETGKATRVSVVPMPPTSGLDFPQLRRSLVGRKNRFGYATSFDAEGIPTAVVKLDLQVCVSVFVSVSMCVRVSVCVLRIATCILTEVGD